MELRPPVLPPENNCEMISAVSVAEALVSPAELVEASCDTGLVLVLTLQRQGSA